jgi:hypothetical protein
MALLTADAAVLISRLRAPKNPLAIFKIFLLFFPAVTPLFILAIFFYSPQI